MWASYDVLLLNMPTRVANLFLLVHVQSIDIDKQRRR